MKGEVTCYIVNPVARRFSRTLSSARGAAALSTGWLPAIIRWPFSCGPCNKVLHVSLNSPLALTIRFNHLTGAIDVA